MESLAKKGHYSMLKAVILAILLILVFALGCSCSSRKKALEITKTEAKKESVIDSATTSKLKTETKTEAKTTAKEVEKSQETEYEGKAGDSLRVTEKDSTGKVVKETLYKGSGKIKIKSSEKTIDKSIAEKFKEQKQSDQKTSVKKQETSVNKSATKNLNVETTGFAWWNWIWIIILIAIGFCLWYLNKRFGWVARVTTFFNE